MLEWAVSSTVLIVAVIALRFILKDRISPRLRYALWAPVLLRLLIPVSFGAAGLSVGNLTRMVSETETAQVVSTLTQMELPRMTYAAAYSQVAREYAEKGVDIAEMPVEEYETVDYEILSRMGSGWTVREIIGAVWVLGIAVMGAALLASNLRFAVGLRKSRRKLDGLAVPLPVYISRSVETPCLFGLLRPAVYITPEVAADDTVLRHVVEHELSHFRHGDHIWPLLRGACLALHWYNPLVWRAALLSRGDSELACDEAAVRRIGESERAEYGRTLIRMTCEKRPDLLGLATTMTGNKSSVKERVMFIAKKPKTTFRTFMAAVLIAAFTAGCAFTGPQGADTNPAEDGGLNENWRNAELTVDENGIPYIRYGAEDEWVQLGGPIAPPVEWAADVYGGGEGLAGRNEAAALLIEPNVTDLWARLVSPTDGWLVACYSRGVAAADTYVYKTTDGGETWVETGRPAEGWLVGAVGFLSRDRLIVAKRLFDGAPCAITTDGGDTWEEIPLPGENLQVQSIAVDGGTVTMTVGAGEAANPGWYVMTSRDLGDTWETASFPIKWETASLPANPA